MYAWKKFQFFTKDEVKIPPPEGGDPDHPPKQSLQSVEDTCADSGRGCLILGDTEGLVHFIRGGFRWQSFRAYERSVTHMHQLRTKDVLVVVGDDNAGTVIKILRVNIPQELGEPPAPEPASMIFKTANVTKMQEIPVGNKGDADVTCVRGSDDLQYVAVGLSNGMVLLYRGPSLDQVSKFPPQSSTTPITGLFFKSVNQSVPTVLFALTADTVATHLLDVSAGGDVSEVLDSNGCQAACCVQSTQDNNIFAGRDEGVFSYAYDGGNCAPAGFKAFDQKGKRQLISFARYLLVAHVNEQGDDMCTVYDLDNQFVAASNPFVAGIRRVFHEWDSVVVLTNDNRIWRLKERNTADKLEKLFSRNLYDVAAEVAKSSGYDRHKVSDIYRRYGDHQYEKGEYDSAMTQYLETIGYGVEPSYVIQRFLDVGGAGRIDNLVRYLQRLHEEEEANADHTTLLLNCYTQMGNLDKLDEFIRQEGLNYDVETAITVCRQAGFYEQGLFLAQQHGRHSAWLKLQLDQDRHRTHDVGDVPSAQTTAAPGEHRAQDCAAALEYIRGLPTFEDAKSAIMDYGRVLLDALPQQTTDFLIDLCTGISHPRAGTAVCKGDSNLEMYTDIFLGEGGRDQLMVFLERAKSEHEASGVKLERQTTQKVNETLVELYLQAAQGISGETDEECTERTELYDKAMALLQDMEASKVDPDHALVLCHQYGFNEGELHLLSERPGMHRQILEKYMAIDDDARLIEAVQKFAQLDETLWVDVLRHYSQKGDACKSQIQTILGFIETENALPPLMVVEALASGPVTTLDVCQEYLERQFASDFDVIHEDRKESESYRKDTEAAQKEMDVQMKQIGRAGRSTTAEEVLTDSPTKFYLRKHAEHLDSIGVDPAEISGRGSASTPRGSGRVVPVELRSKLEQLGPRPGEASAMPLGSSAGFDLVAQCFSQSVFQSGSHY